VPVPKAEREVVEAAVCEAIAQGHIWLLSGPASILKEAVPQGILTDAATVNPPPAPISPSDLLPESLPQAWQDGGTTAIALATALSSKAGVTLPWATICAAIDAAIRSRMLERTEDSGQWPCEWPGAQLIKLRLPAQKPERLPEVREEDRRFVAEAQLTTGEVQNLAEEIANIVAAAVGYDVKLRVRVEVDNPDVPGDVVQRLNEVLAKVAAALRLEKRG
jgi:hypothetical protein